MQPCIERTFTCPYHHTVGPILLKIVSVEVGWLVGWLVFSRFSVQIGYIVPQAYEIYCVGAGDKHTTKQ